MTKTIRRLRLLKRMESNPLSISLTEEHAEKDLESTCDRIENLGLQKKLDAKNCPNTQKELVQVPEFAKLYQVLCEKGIPSSTVEIMVYLAGECKEHLTQYPEEHVVTAAALNIPHQYRFAYMKFLMPQVRFEEDEQSIATNLRCLSDTVLLQLSELKEQQKTLLQKPFLSYYFDNWHRLDWAELETLDKYQPLQEMLMMLYQWGIDLSLNAASLRALSWLQWEDIPKIRRLRKILAYDTKDLSRFFAYWLGNHAAQYDLNWFLSCWEPLDQERREAILCNRISYLNALYSGRLRIDFERVKEHQVPILIYAVEKRKNHFLNMVSQHSEKFFSLSRQALATLRLTTGQDGMSMLQIRFTWLQPSQSNQVRGWTEQVLLRYEHFRDFANAPILTEEIEWSQLSAPEAIACRFIFHSGQNLHRVAQIPVLRHKLGKCLEGHFQWKGTKAIAIYDDFHQYSFYFEELRIDGKGICGGIILHGAEDLRKATYSVHT